MTTAGPAGFEYGSPGDPCPVVDCDQPATGYAEGAHLGWRDRIIRVAACDEHRPWIAVCLTGERDAGITIETRRDLQDRWHFSVELRRPRRMTFKQRRRRRAEAAMLLRSLGA